MQTIDELEENNDNFSMEMKEFSIINKGEITREELLNTYKKSILKSSISFSIVGIIIAIIGLCFLFSYFDDKDKLTLIYSLGLILVGLLVVGLPFIIILFIPSIMAKQNKGIIDGFKYKYLFSNDRVDITLVSDETKSHTTLKYNLISKTVTHGDMVTIYLNANVVYMFKISGFNTIDDMNKAMLKIDKKYKVKNNE